MTAFRFYFHFTNKWTIPITHTAPHTRTRIKWYLLKSKYKLHLTQHSMTISIERPARNVASAPKTKRNANKAKIRNNHNIKRIKGIGVGGSVRNPFVINFWRARTIGQSKVGSLRTWLACKGSAYEYSCLRACACLPLLQSDAMTR